MTDAASPDFDAREEFMPVRRRGSGLLRLLLSNEFGLAILIATAFLGFALALPGFTSPFSLFTIGRQIGIDTMIGLSMMAVIVTGGLDLSVGAIGVCAAMVFGWLAQSLGVPLPLAIPSAILFGTFLGFVNGYAVVRSGVHSFIITLASMSIFFGVMIFLSKAQAFNALPPEVTALGKMRLFGKVSILLVITLAVCAGLSAFYRFTTLGRQMLAAGANPRAAELSGIRTGRVITACHMLTGGSPHLPVSCSRHARVPPCPPWQGTWDKTGCFQHSSHPCSAEPCSPAAVSPWWERFLAQPSSRS